MARTFNGTSDHILFSRGGMSNRSSMTWMAAIRRNSTTSWDSIAVFAKTSATTAGADFATEIGQGGSSSSNVVTMESGGNFRSEGPTISSTTTWYLVGMSHPISGTSGTPTYHIAAISGGSLGAWTHTNGAASLLRGDTVASQVLRVGTYPDTTSGLIDWFDGDFICAAWWNSALTNAQIESCCTLNYNDWKAGTGAVAPTSVWPIGDSARLGTAGASIPDDTGTATWTSTSGTSFVSDPTGWSWGAAAVVLPRRPTITMQAVARAANW